VLDSAGVTHESIFRLLRTHQRAPGGRSSLTESGLEPVPETEETKPSRPRSLMSAMFAPLRFRQGSKRRDVGATEAVDAVSAGAVGAGSDAIASSASAGGYDGRSGASAVTIAAVAATAAAAQATARPLVPAGVDGGQSRVPVPPSVAVAPHDGGGGNDASLRRASLLVSGRRASGADAADLCIATTAVVDGVQEAESVEMSKPPRMADDRNIAMFMTPQALSSRRAAAVQDHVLPVRASDRRVSRRSTSSLAKVVDVEAADAVDGVGTGIESAAAAVVTQDAQPAGRAVPAERQLPVSTRAADADVASTDARTGDGGDAPALGAARRDPVPDAHAATAAKPAGAIGISSSGTSAGGGTGGAGASADTGVSVGNGLALSFTRRPSLHDTVVSATDALPLPAPPIPAVTPQRMQFLHALVSDFAVINSER
jgi:hypothetical protein